MKRLDRSSSLRAAACGALVAPLLLALWLRSSAAQEWPNFPSASAQLDDSAEADDSAEVGWRSAQPGHAWSFPSDHWAHDEYKVEWWYLTGHLHEGSAVEPAGAPARFAYQLTFFRIGLAPSPPALDSAWNARALVMGHAAITDRTTGEHRFSELLYRESELLAGFGEPGDPRIVWSCAPSGTDAVWELRWNGEAFDLRMSDARRGMAFELATRPRKPLVFQGPGGLSRKSNQPGAASLYYSFTRLTTQGQLTLDGVTRAVSGESWMDHEISSSQLTADQVGWDWLSLQLNDGREVMLYELRDARGRSTYARGTRVTVEGEARPLTGADWRLQVVRRWRSEASGVEYPAGWILQLEGEPEPWSIDPDVADQENRSRLAAAPTYWEGAVTIRSPTGELLGRGFVELTGYGEGNRPPL